MKKILAALFLSAALGVQARFHSVSSDRELEKLIGKYPYVVACVVQTRDEDGSSIDKHEKNKNKDIKDAVRSASRSFEYDGLLKHDVGFIWVDASGKDEQEIKSLTRVTQIPQCVLFEEGVQKHKLEVYDSLQRSTLLGFIEQYAQVGIDTILQERKQQATLDQQERIARYRAYHWYPGYGPYWTYYGPRGMYGYSPYYPYYGSTVGVHFVHHSNH